MLRIIIGFLSILLGLVIMMRPGLGSSATGRLAPVLRVVGSRFGGLVLAAIGLLLLGSTSFVHVDANQVGHLKRIFAFQELPPGRIIALPGQKGPQARILGPGFHFIPLVHVLYRVESRSVITVPDGFYGEITTRDGQAMPEGMFIAPRIPDDKLKDMLKAETYLTKGGYRGPQETVLKPGSYRLNQYLFSVRVSRANNELSTRATLIPAGHVGVVKSNVKQPGAVCIGEKVAAAAKGQVIEGALSVPLVPRGCVGIWREPLLPGAYYLNRQAYEITLIDTRVRTEIYKGGYTKRIIDLSLDQQGKITQRERSEPQPVPQSAVDKAVFVKMEGWDVPLELRVLVQIAPENAPVVVGSVGGLEEVEKRILTPAIRSIVRNVAGGQIQVPVRDSEGNVVSPPRFERRHTRVLDLINNRDALEQTILRLLQVEGHKAGVEIKEVRLGEPSIPPELLISRVRVQLADQLSQAYERETSAQRQRIETEKAKATADQQTSLVAAQIAVQVAEQREKERAALGRAERQYLEELAKGQNAQANVLGKDRVALLQALEKMLAALERKPELVQLVSRLVPHTVVSSDGGGLAGAAAILGNAFKPRSGPAPAAPRAGGSSPTSQ